MTNQGEKPETLIQGEAADNSDSAKTKPPNNKEAHEFLLKQYESLRREIEKKTAAFELLTRFGLVGTAVAWAWLLTKQSIPGYRWISFTPFIASVLFFLKVKALNDSVMYIGSFISDIESEYVKHYSLPSNLGWESLLKQRRSLNVSNRINILDMNPPKLNDHTLFGNWDNVFWIVLCAVNLLIPILLIMP